MSMSLTAYARFPSDVGCALLSDRFNAGITEVETLL